MMLPYVVVNCEMERQTMNIVCCELGDGNEPETRRRWSITWQTQKMNDVGVGDRGTVRGGVEVSRSSSPHHCPLAEYWRWR
jgi:hypothetical protein